MAIFLPAYKATNKAEGGYVNDPKDNGGETYKGIARNKNPKWEGWPLIDSYKKKANFPANLEADQSLQDMKLAFYKSKVWDELCLDKVNDQNIALELYDTGTNMGTDTAAEFLQKVLNVSNKQATLYPDVAIDGELGPQTIKALNAHPKPLLVLKALNALQGAKYINICLADPTQEKYFYGWMERVMEYTIPSYAARN